MEIPKRPLTFEEVLEKYGNTQVYFCYNCWTSSTLTKSFGLPKCYNCGMEMSVITLKELAERMSK